MIDDIEPDHAGGFYRAGVWLYALAIVYVSIVVTKDGFDFVPRDLGEAWHGFVNMPYLIHGSDQQQDWMANLLMFGGFGFLLAGTQSRGGRLRTVHGLTALVICVAFLLTVKYAQLFFPPRTVSINYVLAQTGGSIIGIAAYALLHRRLARLAAAFARGGRRALIALSAIYTGFLFAFFLFPFDFTFNAEDLRERLAALPDLLFALPHGDRDAGLRLVLVIANTLTTSPVGMLLRAAMPRRSATGLMAIGCAMMIAILIPTLFVMNATPMLVAIAYRTLGVGIGIAMMGWLDRGGLLRAHRWLRLTAPLAVLPYVLIVAFTKGLVAREWLSLDAAIAQFDGRGLVPFWHYYIVTKTLAVRGLLVHLLIYAVIGVLIWLRAGAGRATIALAALVGFSFALAVEIGRFFRPDLVADLSSAIIGAVAAALAVQLMPWLWQVLTTTTAHAEPDAKSFGAVAVAADAIVAPAGESTLTTGVQPATHAPSFTGMAFATIALATTLAILAAYPVSPGPLTLGLFAYAGLLWWRPTAWLVTLPAGIVALDFMPWTGWVVIGEADLLVLVTLAILALRRAPSRADVFPRGFAGAALGLFVVINMIGVAMGFVTAADAFQNSANPYLHPINALRASKGFWVALLLLPFIAHEWRLDRRTPRRLAQGFAWALAVVVAGAVIERVLFTGLLDFSTDYRIVSTFMGMHLGGSQIAMFLVLAMPFTITVLGHGGVMLRFAVIVLQLLTAYALVVSYARAAYASAIIGIVVLAIATIIAARRPTPERRASFGSMFLPLFVLVIGAGSVVFGALSSSYMQDRFRGSGGDMGARLANWSDGLALRDLSILSSLFGEGSGTFPRLNALRGPPGKVPSDYRLVNGPDRVFLTILGSSTIYFGQKLASAPDQTYALSITWRAPDGKGSVAVTLCEKLVLYSINCASAPGIPAAPGLRWTTSVVSIPPNPLAGAQSLLWPRRPFDFAFWSDVPDTRIDVAEIKLTDARGRDVLINGDFKRGLERWYVSDDYHWPWRIENEYVATLFDGGLLRLASLLLLLFASITGAMRLVSQGSSIGPAILAAIVIFAASCLFDTPLQAPRLATLSFLIVVVALFGLSSNAATYEATLHPPPPASGRRRRRHRRSPPRHPAGAAQSAPR